MAKLSNKIKKLRRKRLKSISNKTLKNQKNKFWLLVSILKPQKRKKKDMIYIKSHILTVIKEVIKLIIILIQKTSPNLGNLDIDN